MQVRREQALRANLAASDSGPRPHLPPRLAPCRIGLPVPPSTTAAAKVTSATLPADIYDRVRADRIDINGTITLTAGS